MAATPSTLVSSPHLSVPHSDDSSCRKDTTEAAAAPSGDPSLSSSLALPAGALGSSMARCFGQVFLIPTLKDSVVMTCPPASTDPPLFFPPSGRSSYVRMLLQLYYTLRLNKIIILSLLLLSPWVGVYLFLGGLGYGGVEGGAVPGPPTSLPHSMVPVGRQGEGLLRTK